MEIALAEARNRGADGLHELAERVEIARTASPMLVVSHQAKQTAMAFLLGLNDDVLDDYPQKSIPSVADKSQAGDEAQR